jgi:hypothetical protein
MVQSKSIVSLIEANGFLHRYKDFLKDLLSEVIQ